MKTKRAPASFGDDVPVLALSLDGRQLMRQLGWEYDDLLKQVMEAEDVIEQKTLLRTRLQEHMREVDERRTMMITELMPGLKVI